MLYIQECFHYSVMLLPTLLQFTLGQKSLIFSVDTGRELACQ